MSGSNAPACKLVIKVGKWVEIVGYGFKAILLLLLFIAAMLVVAMLVVSPSNLDSAATRESEIAHRTGEKPLLSHPQPAASQGR